jgi:putative hydrolase of the HAD superfamily
MTVGLSHIRGIIWDLDGTLYRYNDHFIEACNVAAAQTVVEIGLNVSYNQALIIARNSQKQAGHSFKLFGDMGIQYSDYHHPFHDKIDHLVLTKNLELKSALGAVSLPMVVLTNASRDWAIRALSHLDLLPIFKELNIFSLEDVGFKPKAHHTDGFDLSLKHLGVLPKDAMIVEDLSRNLVVPKKMGITTVLVHHNNEGINEGHVDYVFEDTIDVIKFLS